MISGGRFLFGVGAGWNEDEMNNHGTELQGRFKLMRERVAAMKEIWAHEEAEFHGDLVDFDPIVMNPKPVQEPHPPVHVGGAFPGGARRAVAWGDGWMPIGGRGKGDLADHITGMRRMAEDADRDPADIEVSVYYVPTDPEALARLADIGVDRAIFNLPPMGEAESRESLDRSMEAFRQVEG